MTKRNATPAAKSVVPAPLLDRPYLLLILAPLFWGGNLTAGVLAVGEIDPMTMSVLRWLGAALLVLPFALPHLRRDAPAIRAGMGWLAFYGVVGFTTFNLLIYGASHFTTGVNSAMEQALIPVIVMIGNFFVFGVRARPLQILGVGLTIFGVMIVATHGDPARLLSLDVNQGDAMVILACLCYAVYSLTLRYKPEIHWMSFILIGSLFALLAALAAMLVLGGGAATMPARLSAISATGWWIVAYIAIFPSILAQLCYARGVQMIGPNRASIFINLLPVFGSILALAVAGEVLAPFHAAAALFIVGGIVLAEYAIRRPGAAPARSTGEP